MSTLRRVGHEYLLQIIAFAIAIADRLLIPGILLRKLGVEAFSGWTVVMAYASLLMIADFGASRYFSNRTLALQTAHRQGEAVATFRLSVTLLAMVSIIGSAGLLFWASAFPLQAGSAGIDAQLPHLLIPVIGVFAVQQVIGMRQMLYRAHQQFARESALRAAADIARIAILAAAALAGAELISLGWIWLATSLIVIAVPVLVDTRRRFPVFRGRLAWPTVAELRAIARAAPGYWLLAMSATLFAALPVLVLGFLASGAAVIVQFALMRTIANLVRQVLQMFANVFGLELARRRALNDDDGYAQVFAEAARLLGVQAAVVTVVLMLTGRDLFGLWTGVPGMFDPAMLALAILPPILVPGMMLSAEALAYAERPWAVVRLRLCQAALSLVAYLLLPVDHVGMRMMAALAIGEVFGFGLPLLAAVRGLSPHLTVRRQWVAMGLTYIAAVAAVVVMAPEWLWPAADMTSRLVRAALLGSLAFVGVVGIFGLTPQRRGQVIAAVRSGWRGRTAD